MLSSIDNISLTVKSRVYGIIASNTTGEQNPMNLREVRKILSIREEARVNRSARFDLADIVAPALEPPSHILTDRQHFQVVFQSVNQISDQPAPSTGKHPARG